MARVVESAGTEIDRIFFELDQFKLAGEDRLEVRGRWFGVRGRRFVRPTLLLEADGERRRALADLEHKPWFAQDGEPWEASFRCGVDGAEVRDAELAVAPDIAIPLPAPNGRRPEPTRIPARGGRERRPLRRVRASAGAPTRRDELAEARREIERLRAELKASNAARLDAHGERDHARSERDQVATEREELRARLSSMEAQRDEAREAITRAQAERDEAIATYGKLAAARDQALSERSAALAARAEMAAQRDDAVRAHAEAVRSRDEAVRLREQALDARDHTLAELELQRQAAHQIQAEREAEIASRGAAMVMLGARRAAPVARDWTPRAIAIAVLVVAVLALLLIVRPF
jgi:hypothetical protein